jgi:hypothetical protein
MDIEGMPGLPPVAVGGVGGSGTRLIAEILRRLDYHVGEDLNEAGDNLWFPLLFKRVELVKADSAPGDFDRAVHIFRAAMIGDGALTQGDEAWVQSLAVRARPRHSAAWLGERAESLVRAARQHRGRRAGRWGWKAPNTHVFLDRLPSRFPEMRYIHVMRNGLDMAHSANQNQLKLWGRHFFGHGKYKISPRWSLKYWCLVHRRITTLGSEMSERYLLLNYDAFCAAPREGLRELLRFLDVSISAETESALIPLVHPPESIGRFKRHGLQPFDPEDVAYVQSLGFDADVPRPQSENVPTQKPAWFPSRSLRRRRGPSCD